jgi:hypothetical protein
LVGDGSRRQCSPRRSRLGLRSWPQRAGMRAFLEYLHDWIGESGYY